MTQHIPLTDSNFMVYAAKHYNNPHRLDDEEFLEDLSRIKYIKRLFNKYEKTGDLKERLILNHLVILYNVFGISPTTKMLFLKLQGYEPLLKPFLVKLSTLPDTIRGVGSVDNIIYTSDIIMNPDVVDIVRKI